MKINYKNTALGLLDNPIDVTKFRIISDGENKKPTAEMVNLGHSIVRIWPNISPEFKKNVRYISEPFYKAYEKGAYKLSSVLDNEPIDESGTFIFRASDSEINTIFYRIQTKGTGSEWDMDATILIFNNHSKRDKPSLGIVCQRRFGFLAGEARFYASKNAIEAGVTSTSVIVDLYTIILFLKYCEVETKVVKASGKVNHMGIKYVNDTKSEIEVLDSTWFTTITRSDSFHVRGHFRFQPYGPNSSQRKLIWISDYDKEGYTRIAKVLNQNQNK